MPMHRPPGLASLHAHLILVIRAQGHSTYSTCLKPEDRSESTSSHVPMPTGILASPCPRAIATGYSCTHLPLVRMQTRQLPLCFAPGKHANKTCLGASVTCRQGAQRAEAMSAARNERATRVEAHMRRVCHKRVAHEPGALQSLAS